MKKLLYILIIFLNIQQIFAEDDVITGDNIKAIIQSSETNHKPPVINKEPPNIIPQKKDNPVVKPVIKKDEDLIINNSPTKDLPQKTQIIEPPQPKTQMTDKEKYPLSSWSGSIVFDEYKIRALAGALANYKLIKEANKNGNRNNNKKMIFDIAKLNISPSFYLKSLIYHNPKSWTIWLNNHVLSSSDSKDQIRARTEGVNIVRVSTDYVTFEYRTQFIEQLSPGWKDKLVENEDSFSTIDKNVIINSSENSIIFTLNLNQTFVTYKMAIVEGYAPDTSIAKIEDKLNSIIDNVLK